MNTIMKEGRIISSEALNAQFIISENIRKSNEEQRKLNELQRENNEVQRKQNENERNYNEDQREIGFQQRMDDLGNVDATQLHDRLKNVEYNVRPSILRMNLKDNYRGWQGVTATDECIYTFTDRNENFGLENIISVYSLDGVFITEKRNAFTGLDDDGHFLSFGDGNVIDGRLFVTVYNINGGGTHPYTSKIVVFDTSDLSINNQYEIGNNIAESVTKKDGYFWVVYHDVSVVRKFDSNFNFIKEYSLHLNESHHGFHQGSLWEGNTFYTVLHGHNNINNETMFAQVYAYEFDGTNFNYKVNFEPPNIGCGQGLSKFRNYYLWNDRATNTIIISNTIDKGNIYCESLVDNHNFSYKPTLLNGWNAMDAVFDRTAKVTILNNVVYLSGIIKNTFSSTIYDGITPIFQLPPQYRPKYSLNFIAACSSGLVRVPITGINSANTEDMKGVVGVQNISNYDSIQWISLDGISYPLVV